MTRVHARDAHSRLAGRFVLLATASYFLHQFVKFRYLSIGIATDNIRSLYDGIGRLIKPCLKIECATAWVVVGFLAIGSVEILMTTGINTGSVLMILMPELKSPRTTRRGAFAYKAITGHTGIVDPS